MAETILTKAQLNRTLLARQFLLERTRTSVTGVLEQCAGFPSQHSSAYFSLAARIEDFEPQVLTRCLEDHSVIQSTLMRQAVHLVTASDYSLMTAGVRKARRARWLRVSKSRGLTEDDYEDLAFRVGNALSSGPLTRSEILVEIETAGYPKYSFEGVELWLDLVRVPPAGTWEHPLADRYSLADRWTDSSLAKIADVEESDGLDLLLQRYLRAFGPAQIADIASWAGVPAAALGPSLERLDLSRYRSEDDQRLYDLPYGPLTDPTVPVPVRFLPTWDAALLVHARRAGIVPDRYRDRITKATTSVGAGLFLVDGYVAGSWRHLDGEVNVEPFSRLRGEAADRVDAEAKRLAQFHSAF